MSARDSHWFTLLLVAAASQTSGVLRAQPPTVPLKFESKTEAGIVEIVEVSKVRTFGRQENVEPYLLVRLRVQRPKDVELRSLSVKEATDDTGASLLPPPGAAGVLPVMPNAEIRILRQGNANIVVGGEMPGLGAFDRDLGGNWLTRTVTLATPQPKATAFRSLVLTLSCSAVTSWEQVRFDPAVTGANSMKQQSWAQVSLLECRPTGEGAFRQLQGKILLKRIRGEPNVGTHLFQCTVKDAAGKEFPGVAVKFDRNNEGLAMGVRWVGLPEDFRATEIVFRFPNVETREVEAKFKDVPLP